MLKIFFFCMLFTMIFTFYSKNDNPFNMDTGKRPFLKFPIELERELQPTGCLIEESILLIVNYFSDNFGIELIEWCEEVAD